MNNDNKTIGEYSFIEEIKKERDKGYGFVPLVGAGLSAPSGVPLIKEIHQYLQKCIALALGANRVPVGQEMLASFHRNWRWHPQRDEWPPPQSGQSYRRDDINWQRHVGKITDQMTRKVSEDKSLWDKEYPETDIFREAYGATAEWRSSLLFLARLRERDHYAPVVSDDDNTFHKPETQEPAKKRNASKQRILRLGPVDPDVIDNFFLNVVLGKTPTLGHKMLARLASPLRIDTVLTQNFEDLIEQAFEEIGNILTVYAVHLDAGLPSYHSKFGKNALIKLHGDRYGLRADYSLDEHPSEDDCRHFTSYLSGGPITHEEFQGKSDIPLRNHLLVVGISAEEERLMAMIRRAKEALSRNPDRPALKVFWIAYTRSDFKKATAYLEELFGGGSGHFQVIQHHFPGLLFFRMYQQLTGAIPFDGAIFPSQPRLPVPPERSGPESGEKKKSLIDSLAKGINKAIAWCIDTNNEQRKPNDRHYKLVLVYGKKDSSIGAITAAAETFKDQLDEGRQAVWIDLDEIVCTDELFEVMLATIARKAGVVDWMPVLAQIPSEPSDSQPTPGRDETGTVNILKSRQQELARLTNNPNRQWIVYLNTRGGGAGSNSVPVKMKIESHNGWIEFGPNMPQEHTGSSREFLKLIGGICQGQCPNITIVLLCYGETNPTDKARVGDETREEIDILPIVPEIMKRCPIGDERKVRVYDDSELAEDHKIETIEDAATTWIEDGDKEKGDEDTIASRTRFLYACVAVNRVRSPALLWSWAFHSGNHDATRRMSDTGRWLNQLEEKDVVRIQKGGFVWMRSDVRKLLRKHFQEEDGKSDPPYDLTIRIHQGLAEWYGRLHVSSKSARAVTEVVYHRNEQAHFILKSLQLGSNVSNPDQSAEAGHRILQVLRASLRILRQGRPSILSSGFTQGTCRRLEKLRETFMTLYGPPSELLSESASSADDAWEKWVNPEGGDAPSFGEAYRKLCKTGTGRQLAQEIAFLLCQLHDLTLTLNMAVAQEIGYHQRAFKRWSDLYGRNREECFTITNSQNFREDIRKVNRLATLGIATRSDIFPGACTYSVMKKYHYTFFEGNDSDAENDIGKISKDYETQWSANDRNALSDYIRTETKRWLDKEAGDLFRTLLKGEADKLTNDGVDELIRSVDIRSSRKENIKLQLAEGILKTLQRRIQMNLCNAFYAKTLSRRLYDPEDDSKKEEKRKKADDALLEARQCYELAIELKRAVQHDGLRYQERDSRVMIVGDQISSWFDDQQRLDTQHAVCLAFRGDYTKAQRRLNEAEATLVELHHSDGIERGIIELHRADILLWQAVFKKADEVSLHASIRENQLREFTNEYDSSLESGKHKKLLRQLLRKGAVVNQTEHARQMNKTLSFIEDSWQALDRAKPILEQFRKNAWWSTWYFELRIKLIEMQLFASLNGAHLSSLPFIGTSAVPYNWPTMADVLLDNSRRIIRTDIYRLARVVESYSNCLLVLGLWRFKVIDKLREIDEPRKRKNEKLIREACELESREENMLRWLAAEHSCSGEKTVVRGPLHILDDLLNQRRDIDKDYMEEVKAGDRKANRCSTLSEDVSKYADKVISHAERVEKFTKENVRTIKAMTNCLENEPFAWYLKRNSQQS